MLSAMSIKLENVISPGDPGYKAFEGRLQGNILKSHGRNCSRLLLLEFRSVPGLRKLAGELAIKWCTSAEKQEEQIIAFKKDKTKPSKDRKPDQLFGTFMMSVWGYRHLGYTQKELCEAFPEVYDPTFSTNWFLNGMEHHGAQMCDPPRTAWDEKYFDHHVDAILLLACNDEKKLEEAAQEAASEADRIANVFCIECGQIRRDKAKKPIELFGFRDGVSQPTLLASDAGKEQVPARTVLVPDTLADDPDAFGTYVVYRKLEQNVAGFQKAEEHLADELGLTGDDRKRAGAMIIGRFRNGTPLVSGRASRAVTQETDLNGFDFAGDLPGSRCPLHAHIRKVRPDRNGDSTRRILRRGVSYGNYDPINDVDSPPEKGVGLLFLAYMANIQHQFGFIQTQWVNKVDFPHGSKTGPDPLIGQGKGEPMQQWQAAYEGNAEKKKCGFARFVTLKGGEFLFVPSMRFFERLMADNTGL